MVGRAYKAGHTGQGRIRIGQGVSVAREGQGEGRAWLEQGHTEYKIGLEGVGAGGTRRGQEHEQYKIHSALPWVSVAIGEKRLLYTR